MSRQCVGGLLIGSVVEFQDIRDELRGDNVGVVKAQVVSHSKTKLTTSVRSVSTNRKYILHNHHSVEVISTPKINWI